MDANKNQKTQMKKDKPIENIEPQGKFFVDNNLILWESSKQPEISIVLRTSNKRDAKRLCKNLNQQIGNKDLDLA